MTKPLSKFAKRDVQPRVTKIIAGWFALAAVLGMSWDAAAQRAEDVEPQLLRLRLSGGSVGAYAEGSFEEVRYRSGLSATYSRYFVGPQIGVNADGSIYHPNLFQYNLSGDFVVGWNEEKTTGSGTTVDRSGFDYIGNFSANALVFGNKPYRANLFATSSHSFREYDFFNQVMVDSLRYGGSAGYSQGPVPFNISILRYEEDTDGFGFLTSLRQTTVNLEARNDREFGNSVFNYGLNDFERSTGSSTVSGIEHSFALSDRETFGTHGAVELRNSVGYSKRDLLEGPSDATPGDALTGSSRLILQHTKNLMSTYDGHYLRDDADTAVTENIDGGTGVQHQLFSSLTSGLRFQALRYTSAPTSGDGEFESTQYTASWSESYSKKLGSSARLSLGGSLGRTHTDQQSGSAIEVISEAHTFNPALADSFFLNLFNADPVTIRIFDQGRTIRYTRGIDYNVTVVGGRILIGLIPANPSGLTASTPVIVDYEAAAQGTGTIDGNLSDAFIRLDLFDGMLGIYGRFSEADYTASKGLIVEDMTDTAFGVEFFRQWFRAGAEYQIHEATFASYTAARLYQSFSFMPDDTSSLNVTFSEGRVDFESARGSEEYYSAIARYHHLLTRHLAFDLDAGVSQRFGVTADQFLAAVRPGLAYNIGQLSAKVGYEFEYQESLSTEERIRHRFFLRLRRSF